MLNYGYLKKQQKRRRENVMRGTDMAVRARDKYYIEGSVVRRREEVYTQPERELRPARRRRNKTYKL